MSKRKRTKPHGSGVCVYCLASVQKVEAEHVFPESWYPDGTPNDRMVLVPSCAGCNRAFGAIEERLRLPLIMTIPPNDPQIRGVVDRAMKSITSTASSSVRGVSHAAKKLERLFDQIHYLSSLETTDRAIWTGVPREIAELQTPGGLFITGTPVVRFNPKDTLALGTKFVRGCYFDVFRETMPLDTEIRIQLFADDPGPMLNGLLASGVFSQPRGTSAFGYRVFRAEPPGSIWLFLLWQRLLVVGMAGNAATAAARALKSTD